MPPAGQPEVVEQSSFQVLTGRTLQAFTVLNLGISVVSEEHVGVSETKLKLFSMFNGEVFGLSLRK